MRPLPPDELNEPTDDGTREGRREREKKRARDETRENMATGGGSGGNFISYIFDVVVRAVPPQLPLLLRQLETRATIATCARRIRLSRRRRRRRCLRCYMAATNQLDINCATAHLRVHCAASLQLMPMLHQRLASAAAAATLPPVDRGASQCVSK